MNGAEPKGPVAGQQAERVAKQLRDMIRDGGLQQGVRLASLSQLATELGVRREVVRSAQLILEGEGILERGQGARARVATVKQRTGYSQLLHWLERLFCPSTEAGAPRPGTVTIDAFSLTAETLYRSLRDVYVRLEGVERRFPERLVLRLLLPRDGMLLDFPRLERDRDDCRPSNRIHNLTKLHIEALDMHLQAMRSRVGMAYELEVRRVGLTPYTKLYLLNDELLLEGSYELEVQSIEYGMGSEKTVEPTLEIRGVQTPLLVVSASDASDKPRYEDRRRLFDSHWNANADSSWVPAGQK